MKKRYLILTALAAFLLALPMLLATGADYKVITVAEARQLEDDAKVALEGFIIEDLSDNMFLFRDATGDIDLEIDEKVWNERDMDPDQVVRVFGEIDRENDSLKVEVETIIDIEIILDEEEIEEENIE
ncbi:MAG: NirD/YgiW/YdeI family stress tolerance protein [Planctomycetes bacterium]|nr:NirD/YgiW/YdeI family stress tolerance protein [Planctomycetota bacterium]